MPPADAVMVTVTLLETVDVRIGSSTDVAPAGIVTDDGAMAACGFEFERSITTPPAGAGPESATLPPVF